MTTLRKNPAERNELSTRMQLSAAEAVKVDLGTLGVAAYTTDAHGTITGYNQAAADLWGRHPTVGSDLWCGSWRLFWPDGQPMAHEECPMAITLKENRAVRAAEAIAERPDGGRVWFVPYPTPIRGEDGHLTGALNVLVDVTARKAHEMLIQQQREHLEGVFRSPAAGIAEVRADATFAIVNAKFCALAGRGESELLSVRTCFDITHPDDVAAMRRAFASLHDGADFSSLEQRFSRPDGSVVWLQNGVSAVRDGSGSLCAAILIVNDISERKEAEKRERDAHSRRMFLSSARARLSESLDRHRLFRILVDLMVPALADWASVHAVAEDGSIDRLAAAYGPESLRATFDNISPVDPSAEQGPRAVLRTGVSELHASLPEPALAETFLDQEKVRATSLRSEMCIPLRAGPDVIAALSLGSLTEGRYTADDLALAEDLAHHASIALENARLYAEARGNGEALARAVAAKDEFLGLISHELMTPLTTIRGNAGVLYSRWASLPAESLNDALADIVHDSERLHRIIENLLLIARAEQGEQLEVEPLLLVRVVNRVIDRHRRHFPTRQFEVIEHNSPLPVEFSEPCLEQVIENLISNAEKYSPAASPITVDIHRTPEQVTIKVLDSGVGLPAEGERIFDAFYRSDDAKVRAAGIGIGLAVCKRLVTAQSGTIWARNRPEGGAEFGFSLPVSSAI